MKKLIFLITIVLFLTVVPKISGAHAAYLKFDKTSYSLKTGETVNVDVIIDAGSEQITSADIYVTYDPTLLEATTVTAKTYFPTVTNKITSGKIYIAGLVDDPATSKTSSGVLATVTFKALKASTAALAFSCDTTSSNTSKIIKNDFNATNIITCTQNIGASVVVDGGSSAASTGTSGGSSAGTTGGTSGGASSGTGGTSTTLPRTGILDNIIKFAVPGMILLLIGTGARFLL